MKDLQTFISECDVCQRNKTETVASPGLLQPLPIPERAWSDLSMDFIEGLPNSCGKTLIFVVVDRLTKYVHFMALAHPYTAMEVAQLFTDNVFKLHGLPVSIVSDRDKVFTSQFWQSLFTIQGTQLNLSIAYHPQSDGQTEVVNRCTSGVRLGRSLRLGFTSYLWLNGGLTHPIIHQLILPLVRLYMDKALPLTTIMFQVCPQLLQ